MAPAYLVKILLLCYAALNSLLLLCHFLFFSFSPLLCIYTGVLINNNNNTRVHRACAAGWGGKDI